METVVDQDSIVTVTESAAQQIAAMLAGDAENAGKSLRVFVEAGGCSGMQYGMVFDERRPDDLGAEFHGVGVVVDPFSANYMRGSVIDFSDALTGGGFKINNPNAHSNCGCGKCFSPRITTVRGCSVNSSVICNIPIPRAGYSSSGNTATMNSVRRSRS